MWPTHFIPKQERAEGDPPPRYYLTTPPYPVQVVEVFASNSTVPQGYLVPSAETDEELTSSAAPVSGLLKDILKRYEIPPESIAASAEPVSGVLKDILKTYTVPPESITSSAEPVSGEMRDIRVDYPHWPLGVATESLASTGGPVSGVLT